MSLPEPIDVMLDSSDQPWIPYVEGAEIKVLCVYPQPGRWVILIRARAGAAFTPHKHLGAGEYFMLKGAMEYRAGTATTGDYGYEPNGAVHEHTTFPEDAELLFIGHGPIQASETGDIMSAESLYELALEHGGKPAVA